jgi:hypothetical protein
MAKTYKMHFNGDPTRKLAILKERAARYGVTFVGDIERGQFSGIGLSGNYTRKGDFFIVTIKSAPFIYTFDSAAAQIQGFLNE